MKSDLLKMAPGILEVFFILVLATFTYKIGRLDGEIKCQKEFVERIEKIMPSRAYEP